MRKNDREEIKVVYILSKTLQIFFLNRFMF